MNTLEKRSIFTLGLIMTFRMLGLFMILPIFATAATHLIHATPTMIGMALGIYGLTQALFQIPLGMFSDRFGRKSMITLGLLFFAAGSVIAALSHSIEGVIVGRALQGTGAVGSTILALVADVTSEKDRTKAMALMGMTIGLAFAIAMVAGPAMNAAYGLSGIFWFTGVLAILGIALLYIFVPLAPAREHILESWRSQFVKVIRQPALIRLNFSIFIQHAVLTLLFVATPILLSRQLHLSSHYQTYFYFAVLLAAFIAMVPLIILAEKYGKMRFVFVFSILLMAISQLGLSIGQAQKTVWVAIFLWIFFTGFTVLEALLPSLISKAASPASKGTAMGVYSTSQFLGIFLGGSVGGVIFSHFGMLGIFMVGCVSCLLWGGIAGSTRSR